MTTRRMFVAVLLVLGAASAQAQMPNAQTNPGEHPALMACKGDIKRFCSKVQVGEGRVKACMKAHIKELSEPCKEALFQAWLRD